MKHGVRIAGWDGSPRSKVSYFLKHTREGDPDLLDELLVGQTLCSLLPGYPVHVGGEVLLPVPVFFVVCGGDDAVEELQVVGSCLQARKEEEEEEQLFIFRMLYM